MGYVVYREECGEIIAYYEKAGKAKAAVTRHKNKQARFYALNGRLLSVDEAINWCEYRHYEGILKGLRGQEFELWKFLNSRESAVS